MPNLRLALTIAGLWLATMALAGVLTNLLGTGPAGQGSVVGLVLLAVAGTLFVATHLDRQERTTLAAVALAAGLGSRLGDC